MLAWSCLALVGMLHGPGACVARHGACSSRAAITRMEKEFSASELKSAGFPAAKLQAAGFTAEQLKEAGYSAMELLNDAQYEEQAVLDAGYSKAEVEEAGSKALLARGVSAPKLDEDKMKGLLSESEARRLQDPKKLWRKAPEGREVEGEERGWGDRAPPPKGQ